MRRFIFYCYWIPRSLIYFSLSKITFFLSRKLNSHQMDVLRSLVLDNLRKLNWGQKSFFIRSMTLGEYETFRSDFILETYDFPQNKNQRSKRLCLFAHFDTRGLVQPSVIHYLEQLKAVGSDIVFTSSSENWRRSEVEKISKLCIKIIVRKNIGYDFGSWHTSMMLYQDYVNYEQLIFANDSVYGPFFPLQEIFSCMEEKNADIWGLTECLVIRPHLQSYFLVFSQRVFTGSDWKYFVKNFRYYYKWGDVVKHYETSLNNKINTNGLYKVDSFIKIIDVRHYLIRRFFTDMMSPTHGLWDILIREYRFPFLKKKIANDNYFLMGYFSSWRDTIKRHAELPVHDLLN